MLDMDFLKLIDEYKSKPTEKKNLDSIRKFTLKNLYYYENIEEYVNYFQDVTEKLNDSIGYALSLVMKFWIHYGTDLEYGMSFNKQALEIYHSFDDYQHKVGYLSALNNLFIYNNYKGNLLENYKILNQAREICNDLSDPTYYISFSLNSVYLLCNLTLYDQALHIINEMKNQKIFLSPSNIAVMNNMEVKILLYIGLPEEALKKAFENIEYNEVHQVFVKALPLRSLLAVYDKLEDKEKATEIANQILGLIENETTNIDYAEIYYELGRYFRMMGDFQKAYKYFLDAYKFRSKVLGEQLPFLTEASMMFKASNDMDNYLESVEAKYSLGMQVNQVLKYIIKNNSQTKIESLASFGYKYLADKLLDMTKFINDLSIVNDERSLKDTIARLIPKLLNISSATLIMANDIDEFKEDVISECSFKSDNMVHLVDLDIPKKHRSNITDIIIVALKNSLNEIIGYLVLKYINDTSNKTERINYFGGIINEIITSHLINMSKYNDVLTKYNKDQLTKCYNRYGLNEILSNHFSNSNEELYYVMMDIDYFKKINDTYGHSCGDLILEQLGSKLIEFFGDRNVARIGGEEFVALVNIHEDIEKILNKFIDIINEMTVVYNEHEIKFTLSIGVSRISSPVIDDAAREADRKLYKVKKDGKNHFVL